MTEFQRRDRQVAPDDPLRDHRDRAAAEWEARRWWHRENGVADPVDDAPRKLRYDRRPER